MNGARGVIINITGGNDLSLVEVSDASTIVQEAADEDANIIFGAVVDPSLKGKVKITVIATGFGPPAARRSGGSPAETPVDMSAYADGARMRAESAPAGNEPIAPRLTIARRSLLDMPIAVGGTTPGSGLSLATDAGAEAAETNPDLDLSALDVPAFLRRQEG